MTLLIAGSIVLILGSAGTLAFGWIDQNERLIWASIVMSAGAAVCLALAFYRSKGEAERPARSLPEAGVADEAPLGEAEEPLGEAEEAPLGEAEAPAPAADGPAATEEFSALDAAGDAGPAAGVGTPKGRSAPTAGRSSSKPARHPASAAEEVVAIPERKKFHRPECRYAKTSGAERMTKAQARRRSFSACGICKP